MKTAVVVPCYDEAERLLSDDFVGYAEANPSVHFFMVNDGSRDATLEALNALATRAPESFTVIDQQPNAGKAEAVRAGMRAAFARGDFDAAGYLDADLATPLGEIAKLTAVLEERAGIEMVFGSRVQLLGRRIERKPLRHYLGRIFATVASETLRIPVYDTQCGAKLFRATPEIAALFEEPFKAGWLFDVEIIARLIRDRRGTERARVAGVIYELPLDEWRDVAGSKVKAFDFVRALAQMWTIWRAYLCRRARRPD